MIKMVKYVTTDGVSHDSQKEAKQHEAMIDTANRLKLLLQSSLSTARPDAIVKHIVLEFESVAAILRMYQKKLPKEKKVAANA